MLLGLIAHLINYIIEECSYGGFGVRVNQEYLEEDEEEFFDNQTENICDYINQPEQLSFFTVKQLRDYCKENNLNGYSKLNKSELIDLITSTDCSQNDTKKYNQPKVVNKKINS